MYRLNIFLTLEYILDKYHNETDNCYNWIRYEKDKEYFLEKEIKEALDKLEANYELSFEEVRVSCSHSIAILSVSYLENEKANIWTKRLEMH